MDLLLVGGTGVVGRPLVPLLVAAGHDVRVVARTPERADLVARLGARPVALPAHDAPSLARAMTGCEAVVDLTTSVPRLLRAAPRRAWRDHDRLRDEGTAAVVAAAERAGVRRVVRDSVAFVLRDGGDAWLDEDAPADPGVHLASSVAGERHVAGFRGEGVVLRLCLLYGPLSEHSRTAVRLARRTRVTPVLGRPDAFLPSLHHDDAAAAVVAALDAPPGTWLVGDDEPLRRRDVVEAQREALGVRRLRTVPAPLVQGATTQAQARSQRVSAARFRAATGWRPRWRSLAEGWPAVVAAT